MQARCDDSVSLQAQPEALAVLGQQRIEPRELLHALQQGDPVVALLDEWGRNARLTAVQQDQENGTLSGLILEKTAQFGIGIGAWH